MTIKQIGVKPYRPDLPSWGGGASSTVLNVLPRTEQSYGPISGLAAYASSALPSRCFGAAGGTDPSGNTLIFAGTASNLYKMDSSGTTFSNVSKSAGAYACPSDQFWKFAVIKSRMIAANIHDPIQTYTMGTSSAFSDLSADAPKARYVAGVKQWLMCANTNDPIGGAAPWRIWWSAYNDPTSWPTPGGSTAAANQSDYTDISGEGGAITGLVGNLGTADVGIFFEHAVWRGVYVGPPNIFDFFSCQGVKGCMAPQSIVQLGAIVYYLGEDGFYAFDGSTSVPIGVNKVDKTILADLDSSYIHRVCGAVDPINKLVLFAYPGAGHSGGTPNKLIAYNWVTQEFAPSSLVTELIFRSVTLGYSLDGLDATGYTLDTLPFSLDSAVWQGGQIRIGAFDSSHFLSFFSGSNLAPTVDTEEIQPFMGQRTFVKNARPWVDGGTPTIAVGSRVNLTDAVSYNTGTAMNSLGYCPQRLSSRYVRGRITLPAASSFSHISGMEIDCDPAGER